MKSRTGFGRKMGAGKYMTVIFLPPFSCQSMNRNCFCSVFLFLLAAVPAFAEAGEPAAFS